MKNLSIVALSVVVMLSGCASSRIMQLEEQQVDVSRIQIEDLEIQKAAEIARQVLEENGYSATKVECESDSYACVRGSKVIEKVGFIFPDEHVYKAEVRIARLHHCYKYEVSVTCKSKGFLFSRPVVYHRDEKEEQKILNRMEQETALSQLKEQRIDESRLKRGYVRIEEAAEVARQVLKENRYSITYLKCESDCYAQVRAKKRVPTNKEALLSDSHMYRTEIKITKKDQGPKYEVSSYWKLQKFMDFSPFKSLRRSHRDKQEEQKILRRIEEKTAVIVLSRASRPPKQPVKRQQVDDSGAKTEPTIRFQRAAEIAKQVLEQNGYSVTHFECKADRYACASGRKSVSAKRPTEKPSFGDYYKYKTQIKIIKKDLGHQYEVSSFRKFSEWLFDPWKFFRLSHRDESEEEKILDDIEQKYNPTAMIILFRNEPATETTP